MEMEPTLNVVYMYPCVCCMLMSEMSTCKEINLNGSAYINYIRKLASILLTELCPRKFIC